MFRAASQDEKAAQIELRGARGAKVRPGSGPELHLDLASLSLSPDKFLQLRMPKFSLAGGRINPCLPCVSFP